MRYTFTEHERFGSSLLPALVRLSASIEINEFERGIGSLIKSSESTYNHELFKFMQENLKDEEKVIRAKLRYLKETIGKIPIVVLDNCDKRNREEQLLMFEVAQWMRENYKCLVVMPMRDSTYDAYKTEPPLDTVVKDLIFRIDPPDLLKVLQSRLEYIARLEPSRDRYTLEGGISVVIKHDEQVEYFKCIMLAIRNNAWAKRIFYSISNRDIRSGIQLFEDFCRSGHIRAEDIFRIRTLGRDFPESKILNALLRKNRKYFDDGKSNFVNLFFASNEDDFPDPFVRIDILYWLRENAKIEGPNQVKGYHKVSAVINTLQLIGHDGSIVYRELIILIKRGLVITESQVSTADYDDLITISPSGRLHLSLLTNLTYLSACAENVIYRNSDIMVSISRRIASNEYLEVIPMLATARDMLKYLMDYRDEFISNPEAYLKDGNSFRIYDLNISMNPLNKMIENNPSVKRIISAVDKYRPGVETRAKITFKGVTWLICILDNDMRGYMDTIGGSFKLPREIFDLLKINDYIQCRVLTYDFSHNSFQLEFIGKCDCATGDGSAVAHSLLEENSQ